MNKAILKIAPACAGEVDRLTAGFSKLLGREIAFDVTEDSTLVGGFVAYIDGKVYDASFASKLGALAAAMREEQV